MHNTEARAKVYFDLTAQAKDNNEIHTKKHRQTTQALRAGNNGKALEGDAPNKTCGRENPWANRRSANDTSTKQ